jgi:hypothetical protein
MVRSASGLEFNAYQLMHIVCADKTCLIGGRNKMKKLIAVFALVTFIAAGLALAENTTPPLTCTTEYNFVGHLGEFDDEGRLLGWVGTISGDIEGVIKWWVAIPFKKTGQASHVVQRWKIWDEDEEVLLLAGEDKGGTTTCHQRNTSWRANGIVTEASEEFEDYIGSQMHESGNIAWAAPGLPDHGTGKFRVAGSSSNAAPGRHSKSTTSWGDIKSGNR